MDVFTEFTENLDSLMITTVEYNNTCVMDETVKYKLYIKMCPPQKDFYQNIIFALELQLFLGPNLLVWLSAFALTKPS